MIKLLVTGATGQVGRELMRALAPLGTVVGLDRAGMDLTDADGIRRAIRDCKPGLIVNAAAYTAVDRAESEPELAHAINAVAPGIIAQEARDCGAALIHYSTDYVYDGLKAFAYLESDATAPLSVYGASKLAGECAIEAAGGRHLILRTSWVYGVHGKNFLLTIRRLAMEREELSVVNDQIGAPTWSRMIAQATALIAARWCASTSRGGTYHLSAGGQTSWFDFARAILELLPADERRRLQVAGLKAIPTSQYPLPAKRPRNSVLSNQKLERDFSIRLPDWRVSLSSCIEDLAPRG